MNWDDLYIKFDELVENGEIDPKEVCVEDWVQDQIEHMACRAYDDAKASMQDPD